MKTIAEHLAAEARALRYEELPSDVIAQVKRSVLDALGIGIGGHASEPSRILQEFIRETGGPTESTVYVSGLRTSCLYAILANGAMVRYLDYIDRAFLSPEARINMGHHCESIPAVLAIAERQHSTGRDVIAAIVLAYELLTKVSNSVGGNHGVMDERGWTPEAMRTAPVMALVGGRLMGLSEEHLANAAALAACYTLELGVLHSPHEQLTMARNLRFPFGAHNGALAAVLAGKGFKAPLRVFEGHHGIADVLTGNAMDLDSLVAPRKGWSILNTWIKNFAAEGRMHGHIEATIDLVKKHAIKPEDVARVRIWTTNHTYQRMANPKTRREPATKYTADHSSYYTTAVAIIDHAVGPDQFTDERLADPRVRELSDKVFVEPDPRLEDHISPGVVEITTTSGAVHRAEVLRPKGHPMNPMTEADVERKFRSMADKVLGVEGATRVIEAVRRLEQIGDIGELVRLMVVPGRAATASPTP